MELLYIAISFRDRRLTLTGNGSIPSRTRSNPEIRLEPIVRVYNARIMSRYQKTIRDRT